MHSENLSSLLKTVTTRFFAGFVWYQEVQHRLFCMIRLSIPTRNEQRVPLGSQQNVILNVFAEILYRVRLDEVDHSIQICCGHDRELVHGGICKFFAVLAAQHGACLPRVRCVQGYLDVTGISSCSWNAFKIKMLGNKCELLFRVHRAGVPHMRQPPSSHCMLRT